MFKDLDGKFEYSVNIWEGPKDYVIVIPADSNEEKKYALKIQNYYKNLCGLDLPIITDKTKSVSKEILVGNTNRRESDFVLSEADLSVKYINEKIVFIGGHTVTLKSAIEKYLRLKPCVNEVFTFDITTDFVSKVLDGYEYVWGDEFEGEDVDFTKWDFEQRMFGTQKIEMGYDKDVINVEDGRLKLHAINLSEPLSANNKYKVPYSFVTKYKMNYLYGYAEIRARLPFYKGAWPSFWGLNIGGGNGPKSDGGVCFDKKASDNAEYGIEVDVFEVFGDESKVIPNIHKWYKEENYPYDEIHGVSASNHSQLAGQSIWDWATKKDDISELSKEYHTYGFEWTEKEMSFYVDGQKYYTIDITKSYDLQDDMKRFQEPIFLMFNNHVFADDLPWYSTLVENVENMPFCYYIDYFRLYQKPGVGELYINDTESYYERK